MPYFIHAPALASSEKEKDLYLGSASVKAVADKWKNIDVLVAGIGTLPDEKEPNVRHISVRLRYSTG